MLPFFLGDCGGDCGVTMVDEATAMHFITRHHMSILFRNGFL